MMTVDARIPKLVEGKLLTLPKVRLSSTNGEWPSFVFLSCNMGFQGFRSASRKELEDELYGYKKELQISEAVHDPPLRRDPLKELVRGFEELLKAKQVFVVEYSNAPETSAPGLEDVAVKAQFYVDPIGETVVFSVLPPKTREL